MSTLELRTIPATHRLSNHPSLLHWIANENISLSELTKEIQSYLHELRQRISAGERMEYNLEEMVEEIKGRLIRQQKRNLRTVINATGIILHTNLGRAVLAKSAVEHIVTVASRYSNLEYHIENGSRGSRHDHIEQLIKEITGAEAAMVVNNNAAAVFLILRELAMGKEVVVSRGQLVEIGGSFRISEIMEESGCILREVGTTNKTHLKDYEKAINERTGLLLKVHTSNFRTIGFTKSVTLSELVALGKKHRIPVYEDLGSGVLYDLRRYGIGDEPLIQEVIAQGADLVSFSGDKLLGGPQAGIIAGRKEWVERLKKNQLARILRVDKLTLSALESTLHLYKNEKLLLTELPTMRDICSPLHIIKERAIQLQTMIDSHKWKVTVREDVTEVGGGTLPEVKLPTWTVAIQSDHLPAHVAERKMRMGDPAIIARISKDELIFDLRTIQEDELSCVAEAINRLFT
ncbi:L-seryl-tRNA(Sec) selenium transferase [Brevibacillus sp. WF146]|uniref:L-seryl-tRNA(Sec) selenium transferase n=1 Tax=Brevibacillus sp. WF146 TaxID=319501 RepID=UPI0007EC6412|nr:L-seryl-tRNA(Sec) selenium transferase [Brevibacillus sp. WF146]UYZ12613.1 L-seryl-tRNA(Sec) selenium transferase [Brevibacillus sp. WF146]